MANIWNKRNSGLFDAQSPSPFQHVRQIHAYKASITPAEILLSFPNSLCAAASTVTVQVAMTCSRRLCIPKSKETL
jgi:hypothetical protein